MLYKVHLNEQCRACTDLNLVCYNLILERGQTLGFAEPGRQFLDNMRVWPDRMKSEWGRSSVG